MRRRSSVADPVVRCEVLTVPAVPPAGVPSGMRTSDGRDVMGGTTSAGAAMRADALFVCAEVPEAVERSNVDVALVPGAVSDSGGVSRLAGAVVLLRCASFAGRRLLLVETNPVLLAPEPDGLP